MTSPPHHHHSSTLQAPPSPPFMYSYTHPSIPSDYDVEDAFSSINAPNYTPTSPDYSRDFFSPEDISPPKDTKTPVESPISVSSSSSVGSSSPVRSTTPPPDYPFVVSIFAELDNSLWIIPRLLGSEPVLEEPDESDTYYNLEIIIEDIQVQESFKQNLRTQKQQGRATRLDLCRLQLSRIQPLDV
ncbi:hypothetical protein Tco_0770731 [Tanacetum coccineum]|uniref:Uncharacterized protein n=1 Tax=Tanacetum coccineum TaxID=301880 RepID=A0ABQ4ZDB0_9ASTR